MALTHPASDVLSRCEALDLTLVICPKSHRDQEFDGLSKYLGPGIAIDLLGSLVEERDPVTRIDRYDRIAGNRQDACEFGFGSLKSNLRPLAIGDINVDASHASRIPAAIVGDEAARFDPPHPAARDNDAVLHIVFAPPLVEGLTTKRIQAPSIF